MEILFSHDKFLNVKILSRNPPPPFDEMGVVGGLVVPYFCGHFKRTLELLNSVKMSSFATFFDHWVDRITPGKKITKNTNRHREFSGKKIQNSTYLQIGA